MNYGRTSSELLSSQDVKRRFEARGETITEWAEANGFSREEVYALLNGRTKGKRGRAHRIAVLLGMKLDPALMMAGKEDVIET